MPCDPDCKSFLGSKGVDPIQALGDILMGDVYGHADISINGNPYTNAAVSGAVQGQAITVNDQGAFFNGSTPGGQSLTVGPNSLPGGTPGAQAFILLHELGHNTGVLLNDLGNQNNLNANDANIQEHCAKTISSFGP